MSDQDINKIPESTNPVPDDLLNEIKDLHLPNTQNDVIHRIFGNPNPTVGEKITYQVKDWKKGLPAEDHDPSKITWELFKQREDGTFTTTNIKKAGDGSFTFGETAWNNTYRLDAYVDETTNIQPLGLIIKPEPSKTPKINKVDLLYVDDTKGTTFSFTEKLRARAYCVNLEFQELTFTLWEDDAKGSGHNSKNKLIAVQKAKVAKNGTAAVDFMLTKALLQKSMQGETDAKQLEFYVTVECFQGKKHATDNVDVKNHLYTPPAKAPEKPKTTPAKTTPAEQKGKSKKDLAFNYFEDTTKILSNLWDYAEAKGKAIFDTFPNFVKPNGNKPATVGVDDKKANENEHKCPNCEKDITLTQIKKIFTDVKDDNILNDLINCFNKYKENFKLNTCARKAHFFAQAIEESGLDLSGALKGESLNYSAEALPIQFKAFRKRNEKGQYIDKNGNPTTIKKEFVPNDLAYQYGRSRQNNNKANQRKIAEIAYGNRPELGNKTVEDAWNFRGRGLLQITGRTNYKMIQQKLDLLANNEKVKIDEGVDRDYTVKEASLTGMADWFKDNMYLKADKTGELKDDVVVDKIVDIINKFTDSRSKRKKHYKLTRVIFEIDKCKNVKESNLPNNKKNKVYDVDKAVEHINQNAEDKAKGKCARYVREAINAGGVYGLSGNATDYFDTEQMENVGFKNIGNEIDKIELKKGDIVAFRSVEGHPYGHIAMWNGSQWVSDFKQKSFWVAKKYSEANDYKIFRWDN